MTLPVRLSFRAIDPSDAIAEYVHSKADKLPTFCDRILSCAVVVEDEHRHARHGRRFRVRIDLTTPGHEVVCEEHGEDVYASLDAAFGHAARQLTELARRRRHDERSQGALRDGLPPEAPGSATGR